jgi:hypothetical protein
MELDIGQLAKKLIEDIEAEKKSADHIITGVKLLYGAIEKEIKRIESKRQEEIKPAESSDRISL